jgi:hypothetical protein
VNARNDSPHTTSAFESRLGEELAELAATHDFPAPARAKRRRPPLAVGVVAAATAAAVAVPAMLSGQEGGAAAFAVTRDSHGIVVVKLLQPSGFQKMIDKLRSYGIPTVGLQETDAQAEACHEGPFPPALTIMLPPQPGDGVGSIRIDTKGIQKGETLVVANDLMSAGGKSVGWILQARGMTSIPSCFPFGSMLNSTFNPGDDMSPSPSGVPSGVPSGMPSGMPTGSPSTDDVSSPAA